MPRVQSSRKPSKAARKQAAEMEARLKELRNQEQAMQKKLSRLECSLVAIPGDFQESRLRNWNVLPAVSEERYRKRERALPRVHQQRIHQARTRQALLALFMVVAFVGFAMWFANQLQALQLMD